MNAAEWWNRSLQFTTSVVAVPLTTSPVAVQPTASLIAADALDDTVPPAIAGAAASSSADVVTAIAADAKCIVRTRYISHSP